MDLPKNGSRLGRRRESSRVLLPRRTPWTCRVVHPLRTEGEYDGFRDQNETGGSLLSQVLTVSIINCPTEPAHHRIKQNPHENISLIHRRWWASLRVPSIINGACRRGLRWPMDSPPLAGRLTGWALLGQILLAASRRDFSICSCVGKRAR